MVGLLLLVFVFYPIDAFTLRLARQDLQIAQAFRVDAGQEIFLIYRHSVEKTAVEGRFRIGPGPSLLCVETRMTSVGTGLPNTSPERTRREGGWIVVDEELKNLNGFRFFLSAVNKTRLVTKGADVDMDMIPSGSVIRFGVERVCLLRWLAWRVFGTSWRVASELV